MHIESVISIEDIPRECIEDCSQPGPADEAVSYWRDNLDFTVDRTAAIKCLRGYGAWEPEELAEQSDDDIAEKILWLACGDFAEFIVHCEHESIDPFGPRPNDFDPSSGSDIFVLE